MKNRLLFIILIVIFEIMFFFFTWKAVDYIFIDIYGLKVFFTYMIVFSVHSSYFIIKYYNKLKEKNKILEENEKQSDVINNLIEDLLRKQHDFKNHLNTIYGLTQIDTGASLELIKKYIKSLNGSLKNLEGLILFEDKVLSALIYSKICEAEKKRVVFQYFVKTNLSRISFKNYEVTELLGNLLDNAFEAPMAEIVAKKSVILTIDEEDEYIYIEVKNNGIPIQSQDVNNVFKKSYISKLNSGHGFGLGIVKNIVKTKRGVIQVYWENEYTVFKIKFKFHKNGNESPI